jgi:hypothetical protein
MISLFISYLCVRDIGFSSVFMFFLLGFGPVSTVVYFCASFYQHGNVLVHTCIFDILVMSEKQLVVGT